MGNGWIKLHRKLLESVIFGNEKGLKVWIWCLLKAGHAEKSILIGRQKITLKPGQFVMGSTTAKESLGLAKATIWYWLNFLEKEGQVRLQRTTKYTIVTLPNWDSHQSNLDTDETQSGRKVGTNKNVKNEEKSFKEEVPDEEVEVRGSRECMAAFVRVNPSLKGTTNKTEFAALRKLITLYGFERVLAVIESLEHTNSVPFIVTITKPTELLRDWAKLHAQVQKKKNEINQPKTRGRGFA